MPINFLEFIQVPSPVFRIEVNPKEIYKRIGYENHEPEEFVKASVKDCIDKSRELIHPKGGFAIYSIAELKSNEGILKVDSIEFDLKRIIATQLNSSEYIAVFAGTIGHFLEQYASSLYEDNDLLDYYIMNSIGSEAAEAVAEVVHREAGKYAAEQRLAITNRFSPGYCGWNVQEQFKLFSLLPDHCCNIRLTDSALLTPVKSVSGMIGLGKNVRLKDYPCRKCEEKDCLYRNRHP